MEIGGFKWTAMICSSSAFGLIHPTQTKIHVTNAPESLFYLTFGHESAVCEHINLEMKD